MLAMHKTKPGILTIERFVASDSSCSFMGLVKGTLALLKILAKVKQLGIPTYFLRLSCADLKWEEVQKIINTLNNFVHSDENLAYSDKQLKYLSYR